MLKPEFENSFPHVLSDGKKVTKEEFLKNPSKYSALQYMLKPGSIKATVKNPGGDLDGGQDEKGNFILTRGGEKSKEKATVKNPGGDDPTGDEKKSKGNSKK